MEKWIYIVRSVKQIWMSHSVFTSVWHIKTIIAGIAFEFPFVYIINDFLVFLFSFFGIHPVNLWYVLNVKWKQAHITCKLHRKLEWINWVKWKERILIQLNQNHDLTNILTASKVFSMHFRNQPISFFFFVFLF